MTKVPKLKIFIFILLLNSFGTNKGELTNLKFTNLECTVLDKEVISIPACRIKAVSRTRHEMTIVVKPIGRPWSKIIMNIQVFEKSSSNRYLPWLFNYTIDACKFFKYKHIPFMRMILGLAEGYTNFNHACPYKDEVYVKDWQVDIRKMPLPAPAVEYLVQVHVALNSKDSLILKIYLKYTEK